MENTKSSKQLKKQLFAAIAMVCVAAIALGTSTYAWFVTNNKVDATTSTISAQSNAAFMTIDNGTSGANAVDTTSVTTQVETKALYPATFGEETGSIKGKFMTGFGTSLTDGTLTGSLTTVDSGSYSDAVGKGYALQQDFNISSKGQNLEDLSIEKIVDAASTSNSELAKALRVLVTNDAGTTWALYGRKTDSTDYEIKLTSDSSNAAVTFGNITAGQDTPVHVYLFYEGKDTNVTTQKLQNSALTATNAVTIHFKATAKNK